MDLEDALNHLEEAIRAVEEVCEGEAKDRDVLLEVLELLEEAYSRLEELLQR